MTDSNRSYAWARHTEDSTTDLSKLSWQAASGLEYAADLAFNGLERSQDIRPNRRPAKLTIADLAEQDGVPAETIEHRIKLARRRLFGNLSDDAIRKRVQRQADRTMRHCAQAGCPNLISPAEAGQRRYCKHHSSGKARTRRHRQQRPRGASSARA